MALPEGLTLGVICEREDPRDALVGVNSFDELTSGARLGTSSLRRSCQIARHRPDLEIKFSSSFSAGDAILNVRPGVLHQVLSNLVGNAIDALSSSDRETSRVWLQADTDWSVAMIRIGDNGPGVSPEIRAQMFERDFTTKGEGGSGIGLSVVRQIISKLGGNVDVVSDPGRGTVVTVALPLR